MIRQWKLSFHVDICVNVHLININLPSTENMFLFSFDLVTKLDENSISHTAVESLLHKFAVQDFIRLKLLPQFLHKRH